MYRCAECQKNAYHGYNGRWYCRKHYPTDEKFCRVCYITLSSEDVRDICNRCRAQMNKWKLR